MFEGMTRKGKQEGRSETTSMPTIEPKDMFKLCQYFLEKMTGPPLLLYYSKS